MKQKLNILSYNSGSETEFHISCWNLPKTILEFAKLCVLPDFSPQPSNFLHGYICHIRDISQLCSTAPAELLELVQSEICYAPVTEIASGGASSTVLPTSQMALSHFKPPQIPEKLKNLGMGDRLANAALDYAMERQMKVRLTHPFLRFSPNPFQEKIPF